MIYYILMIFLAQMVACFFTTAMFGLMEWYAPPLLTLDCTVDLHFLHVQICSTV